VRVDGLVGPRRSLGARNLFVGLFNVGLFEAELVVDVLVDPSLGGGVSALLVRLVSVIFKL
jgi:hypothetical protein